jgi:hypothetical protein
MNKNLKGQHKEPPFRIENGKKIYSLTMQLPPERNLIVNAKEKPKEGEGQDDDDLEIQNAATVQAQADADPNILVTPCRLISSVKTWPSMGWLGAQLVDYSHNNAAAIRQAVDIINSRPRPVPLMWDHSNDMRDKAGTVSDAVWARKNSQMPPGVNANLVVNREYDSKAAKGLETGVIDATSISLWCEMEQSHPDMGFWDFVDQQGETVDGKEVKWNPIATKDVLHHAMVPAGADENSGPLKNSRIDTGNNGESIPSTQGEPPKQTRRINNMIEKFVLLIQAILGKLHIDAFVDAGSELPEGLQDKVVSKLDVLVAAGARYNELASRLQAFGEKLLKEGETALSAVQVLDRLPELYLMAEKGKNFCEFQRKEALRLFDLAKFKPDSAELTEAEKRIRSRIEATDDLAYLEDMIDEYRVQAESKLGKNFRSSADTPLPLDGGKPVVIPIGEDRDIAESVARTFGGGE